MVDVQCAVVFSIFRGINVQSGFTRGEELIASVGVGSCTVYLETVELIILDVEGDGNLLAGGNGEVFVVEVGNAFAVHRHSGNCTLGAFINIVEVNGVNKIFGEVGFDGKGVAI